MKNLKKTIAAGLAMAMALSANVGVFAANEFTASYNEALTEIAVDNITTNENFNAGEQYTVIIGEKSAMAAGSIADADVLYINQGTTAEEFWSTMMTKTTLEVGETYTVRIGGENLSNVYEVDVLVKASDTPTYMLGDVNDDKSVDGIDSLEILKYSISLTTFTELQILAGDVNKDDSTDGIDSLQVLKYSVGLVPSL